MSMNAAPAWLAAKSAWTKARAPAPNLRLLAGSILLTSTSSPARRDISSKRWAGDRAESSESEMNERNATPLAVAIMGLLLAILSYAIKDERLGLVVYGSGLLSAGFALLHWFAQPMQKQKFPPRL
jgi:lipopolysaccharide export LptBFGC system permease protein LptF